MFFGPVAGNAFITRFMLWTFHSNAIETSCPYAALFVPSFRPFQPQTSTPTYNHAGPLAGVSCISIDRRRRDNYAEAVQPGSG